MAAKMAAKAGLKVAQLEKRQEIGEPVRCAGGISKSGLGKRTSISKKRVV